MKTTISMIKADVGSIGGHVEPGQAMIDEVEETISASSAVIDYKIFHTGDDINILMTHKEGIDNKEIHKLAWDSFKRATKLAKKLGLYGAGQDLLKTAFSGNVKGQGPAVAEMEFEERENEPFVLFMADKTDPGCYNLPLFLAFADPMHNAGLLVSPSMKEGFRFRIMDVAYTKADKVIELSVPEDYYDIATLLRDLERFIVEAIYSRQTGEQSVVVSTTRLHNIAGKYTGKDDPVCLVRVQGAFPATGEILSPYAIVPYVAGFMRGSHNGPLMPMKANCTVSYFDGPPVVSAVGFCVHEAKLTEPTDLFDHHFWDWVRDKASRKAYDIREQGFFGAAMLPMSELEYGGIVERLGRLEKKFKIRKTSVSKSRRARSITK